MRLPGVDDLRALVGRRLERGDSSPLARAASLAWGAIAARAVARPLRLPPGVLVVGVGGAVLGGAGKTPLTIALARALASQKPAVIGHAYRAHPGCARVVQVTDAVTEVGDDALAAARALPGVPVIVGPSRQAAVDHAVALGHRLLLVDGLLQTAPERLAVSILVVDALAPWGAGACPPAGDLRAPPAALLVAADHIAAVHMAGVAPGPALPAGAILVSGRIAGAITPDGDRLLPAALRGLRVGLLLTIANPGRVVSALAAAGVHPLTTLTLADHAAPGPAFLAEAARAPVEAWLTTARCATKLPSVIGGAPVLPLDHRLDVSALFARLPLLVTGAGGGSRGSSRLC